MLNQKSSSYGKSIDLTDKVSVVTGGAQGIGFSICSLLAEAGAIVVVADCEETAGRQAVKALAGHGGRAVFVNCDVTDELLVRETVAKIVDLHGGIDILVNNAGIYPRKPFLEMNGNDFRRVIEVNLAGTFLCSRYVAASMVEKKRGGSIINIASVEAERSSSTGMSAYGASKAGVVMLTRSIAKELGPDGIRVNAVSPGGIITKEIITVREEEDGQRKKSQYTQLKDFLKRVPLGRMGEAEDVAKAVLFLASDLSSYITGETIRVDGGYIVS